MKEQIIENVLDNIHRELLERKKTLEKEIVNCSIRKSFWEIFYESFEDKKVDEVIFEESCEKFLFNIVNKIDFSIVKNFPYIEWHHIFISYKHDLDSKGFNVKLEFANLYKKVQVFSDNIFKISREEVSKYISFEMTSLDEAQFSLKKLEKILEKFNDIFTDVAAGYVKMLKSFVEEDIIDSIILPDIYCTLSNEEISSLLKV